jgi:hypothetical protein
VSSTINLTTITKRNAFERDWRGGAGQDVAFYSHWTVRASVKLEARATQDLEGVNEQRSQEVNGQFCQV